MGGDCWRRVATIFNVHVLTRQPLRGLGFTTPHHTTHGTALCGRGRAWCSLSLALHRVLWNHPEGGREGGTGSVPTTCGRAFSLPLLPAPACQRGIDAADIKRADARDKQVMLFVPSINGVSHAFDEDTHEARLTVPTRSRSAIDSNRTDF